MRKLLVAVTMLILTGCYDPLPGVIVCNCPEGRVSKDCMDLATRNLRSCATANGGSFRAGDLCTCEKIPSM